MLFARLLAFLGLLFLAPAAPVAPGDAASGSGLISIDALIEASSRLTHAEQDADGPEGLPVRHPAGRAQLARLSGDAMPLPPVTRNRHPAARPRAPPFQKA